MGRTFVLFLLAVCLLWTFGETLSCDECGRECVPTCGTRKFRACCYNSQIKRAPDMRLKSWVDPSRETGHLRLVYDA